MCCPWCGKKYQGSPLDHICSDGSDLHARANYVVENRKSPYLNPKTDALSAKELTEFDRDYLRGIKVIW
jgi:hypothetical protein